MRDCDFNQTQNDVLADTAFSDSVERLQEQSTAEISHSGQGVFYLAGLPDHHRETNSSRLLTQTRQRTERNNYGISY